MPEFKRADPSKGKVKPDARGRVLVKIVLIDERVRGTYDTAVAGNRKEAIYLDGSTVGEVYDAISAALFGTERIED